MWSALWLVVALAMASSAAQDSVLSSWKSKLRAPSVQFNTNVYYTYEEMMTYMEELQEAYPSRVVVKEIGLSYENRTLKTITITNGDGRSNKKAILLDGGFHAREWLSPATVLNAVQQLVVEYESNKKLLEDYDWIVLPLVNPDGYTYSRNNESMWRKTVSPNGGACLGTDLNRNFDFAWEGDESLSHSCAETYSGKAPFSEPESRALRDVMLELIDSKRGIMYLSVHSYGSIIYYPVEIPKYQITNADELVKVTEAAHKASNKLFAPTPDPLGRLDGTSTDYAYVMGFPLTFTLELPGYHKNEKFGFFPPIKYVPELVEEGWVAIRAMAVKAIELYPLDKNSEEWISNWIN